MNILFIHQNFPGQFKFLAPALAKLGHRVVAMTMQKLENKVWQGVELVQYSATRGSTPGIHPWVSDFETKTIRGEACFHAALMMKKQGFQPDVIVANHGWGESLFLKEVWPKSKLAIYCEFFYSVTGADVNFDPEFTNFDQTEAIRLKHKNLNNLLHFEIADAGISPTKWQASTFPASFREKISIIHDGIDTEKVKPNTEINFNINSSNGRQLNLNRSSEVITFVNRNLEPYRGYHIFMRCLPFLLKERPNAEILIVGGDDVSYGARPSKEKYGYSNWKDIFINENLNKISKEDWLRVHFLGTLPYHYFIPLLQISTVHVYLTYPFVLSWSLIEAMSAGCAIVASNTDPVKEVIKNHSNGLLTDFFDSKLLSENISNLAEDSMQRKEFSIAARNLAIEKYDLKKICLPQQIQWVFNLI
jgi:glycosyltransferase involved in cell wall biosynthesis